MPINLRSHLNHSWPRQFLIRCTVAGLLGVLFAACATTEPAARKRTTRKTVRTVKSTPASAKPATLLRGSGAELRDTQFPNKEQRDRRIAIMTEQVASRGKQYRFREGDKISIKTLYYPELNRDIKIDSYGNIVYPFIGETQAAGLTATELAARISAALAAQEAYDNAQVTVNINESEQTYVHVLGEVRKPGKIEIDRQSTLLGALALAGGQTYDAKLSNVLLIRQTVTPPALVKLNLQNVFKPTSPRQFLNIPLVAGDVVYVPSTQFANVERFFIKISNIIRPLVNLEQGIVLYPTVEDILEGEDVDSSVSRTIVVDGIPAPAR
jgi:polysaccharide export outer membrane protein